VNLRDAKKGGTSSLPPVFQLLKKGEAKKRWGKHKHEKKNTGTGHFSNGSGKRRWEEYPGGGGYKISNEFRLRKLNAQDNGGGC